MISSGLPPAFFTLAAHCLLAAARPPSSIRRAAQPVSGIDLVGRIRLQLGQHRHVHKSAHGVANAQSPFVGAMVVDRPSSAPPTWRVGDRARTPLQRWSRVERCVHVILRHLVDTEERHRAPRGRSPASATPFSSNIAHFGGARLHIGCRRAASDPGGDRRLRRDAPSCPSGRPAPRSSSCSECKVSRDRGRMRSRISRPSSPWRRICGTRRRWRGCRPWRRRSGTAARRRR